jgi:UDP-glucuronate 4-epimerase
MSTYLVTGVAGFIASRVAEMLLAEGHTVVGVDNLNDYYDVRLKDHRLSRLLGRDHQLSSNPTKSAFAGQQQMSAHGRFVFRALDIENLAALGALFAEHKFHAVFNLAARAGVRYSIENPHVYLSTNALGTLNVLECMRRAGVRKHVLASTSSLYAGSPMPFREDQPVNAPLSPYAATKKAAEVLAATYHRLFGIDTTVLRYFTVFGPAGRPDMSPFRFIQWIKAEQPIELFGDGSQARDFTYVDDIARGTILAGRLFGDQLTTPGDTLPEPGYHIINLGGGRNPITLLTMIGSIEQALAAKGCTSPDGSSLKAKIAGKPFHAADMKETWADIAKAEALLGWKPEIGVEEGFRLTVAWHLENCAWLKEVRL